MKKYIISFALLLILAVGAYAWLDTDSPQGHIESLTTPDATIYASTTTAITELLGTAHKGGVDQAAADARGIIAYGYLWWDVDGDGLADAGDEPVGVSSLSAGIDDAVTTVPVASATTFRSSGFVKIDDELISYTGTTGTTLTGATRGTNETTAAAHLVGAAVTAVQARQLVVTVTCNGAPYHTVGWDATYPNDDGTEGDVLQGALSITVVAGRSYLLIWRIVDGNGNTNTEVADVDKWCTHGEDSYIGEDGDAAWGLEDDEVLVFRANEKPRRRFGLR